ncbi:helix-turn-helix domain-containing protein [uncultured Microbacterium sp.]|uniref:helix-turn-helix domain-containing protein n=1 Tax=uncultured Microbacterium sp. TaxID=191216 RepID=UPI002625A4C8|nr:helix-turn-helix domain-containing protein [uncultured Microbacterium sp.]
MSIESMAIALHHSRATGATKLVLIGIANHDGDGGAWPSVEKLAKYAGVDPRSVQRSVRKLEELHEVRRFVQAGGDHRVAEHQRPNRYQFLLTCPPDCDRTSQHRTRTQSVVELPIDELSTGVTPTSPGDTHVTPGVTPTSPKPPSNQTTRDKEVSYVPERASACGHALIDDRHCERGCRVALVTGETA